MAPLGPTAFTFSTWRPAPRRRTNRFAQGLYSTLSSSQRKLEPDSVEPNLKTTRARGRSVVTTRPGLRRKKVLGRWPEVVLALPLVWLALPDPEPPSPPPP